MFIWLWKQRIPTTQNHLRKKLDPQRDMDSNYLLFYYSSFNYKAESVYDILPEAWRRKLESAADSSDQPKMKMKNTLEILKSLFTYSKFSKKISICPYIQQVKPGSSAVSSATTSPGDVALQGRLKAHGGSEAGRQRRRQGLSRVPPQHRRTPLRGEVSHLLYSHVLATRGPSEVLGGASAPGEKSQHLPWRSSGCTRRLVMVSHRAMRSSLSSRPRRLRQPSISGELSPDISTPKRRGEEDDLVMPSLQAQQPGA